MNYKYLLLLSFLLTHFVGNVFAQSNVSQPISVHIFREIVPPILTIKEGSVHFKDADGNNFINANEECEINYTIINSGNGNAYNCVAYIEGYGTTSGLTYKSMQLPTIKAGESHDVIIPIKSSQYTATGDVAFKLYVEEPNGFGTDPIQIQVGTRKFDAPYVEIVSYKIVGEGNDQLQKKKPFKVQVLLQNTDQGIARNVECLFSIPENMFLQDGERYKTFAELRPNEKKLIEYELLSNTKVANDVALEFEIKESYGKYGKNATIPLHFGQTISSGMVNMKVEGKDDGQIKIERGDLRSDVDIDIPKSVKENENLFVVIIANENYQQVAPVPFALNDGSIFKEYCLKTLGVPQKHMHYLANATGNNIKEQINWIQGILKTYSKAKIILYYAGHGIPSESDRTAYLLPIDGSPTDITTAYKMEDLYQGLRTQGAQSVIILLDACFSGSKREEGMLTSARGVALESRSGKPTGNMVVLSAAQGAETAYPYIEKQHGMFTYFMLKKIKESNGNVNLEDLGHYIILNVGQQSIVQNNKLQTPCVIPSAEINSNWKLWTIK